MMIKITRLRVALLALLLLATPAVAAVYHWSTTAANNATADATINWREGMAPSAVNDSARAMMSAIAFWRNDLQGITTGGSSTAYTVTTGSVYSSAALMSNALITIIPHATSGATPTLAVDGLTARNINISTGVSVPSGALILGTPYLVKYVHASTEFIVLGTLGSPTQLSAIDIIGATQLTAPAVDDTLPIYDLSATANRRILVSDFLKVINSLTEDTSPDGAADFLLSYDTSASATKKVKPQSLPVILPRGYIDGCILSNNSGDATNDIDISACVVRDSTNAVNISVCPSGCTKQLDANWVAGTTGGMRNSAAGIADTTYHIYAVATAAGVAGIYAHASTTVATVLTALQAETGGTDYIYARRIRSIVRASAAILLFTQNGDYVRYKTPVLDVSVTNQSTSSSTYTLDTIPTGFSVQADTNVYISNAGNTGIYVRNPDDTDSAISTSASPLATMIQAAGIAMAAQVSVWTNTSSQIAARAQANNTTFRVVTLGYRDQRGKDQ